MKTVGEFKKAGLVFVGDDKLRSETNNHDSDEICMFRCWLGHGSYSGFLEVSDCYFANKEWVISSFAWRESTGVKPEFNGLVEIMVRNGGVGIVKSDSACWAVNFMDVSRDLDIIKWRPSLNQSSIAEPDNKESSIHKAWMALKGDLNNVIDGIQGSKDSILKCISGIGSFSIGDYAFCVGNYHNKSVWEYVCATQEFTSYCEKMAAEEKRMDIIGQNSNDGLHYDNASKQVEVVINNNNPFSIELAEKGGFHYELKAASSDKPIFTQAMADAGELPPVGSEFMFLYDSDYRSYAKCLSIGITSKGFLAFEFLETPSEERIGEVEVSDGKFEGIVEFKPLDNRTDREKAIDEVYMKLYEGKLAKFNAEVTRELIGDIFDAGLLKY